MVLSKAKRICSLLYFSNLRNKCRKRRNAINVSESDMQAIISYLWTQKPVKIKVPDNEYNIMGKIVKAFLLKPTGPSGSIPKNRVPDTSAQYGSYLINYVGNFGGCHTQRDMMTGAYIGEHMAGGNEFHENGTKFITPNLTTDSSSRFLTGVR